MNNFLTRSFTIYSLRYMQNGHYSITILRVQEKNLTTLQNLDFSLLINISYDQRLFPEIACKCNLSRLILALIILYLYGMELSDKAVQEFKQIYIEEYGEDISDDEAKKMAVNLMEFCKIIFRPIPNQTPQYDGRKQEKL